MFKYSKGGITVLGVLDRRRIKSNGLYPVKIEVIYRRRQKYFSAGVDMSEDEWTAGPMQGVDDHKFREVRRRFEAAVENVSVLLSSGRFSIEALAETGPRCGTVNAYLETMAEEFRLAGRINSYYRCRSTLRNVEKFAGRDVLFTDITVPWLKSCEQFWLRDGKNFTTVSIYMKTVKCVMNRAMSDGCLAAGRMPFGKGGYLIPKGVTRKLALSKDQIRKIIKYKGDRRLERYRDLWLFSYLCNGINFKDMLLLKYRNVINGEVCFVRSKTESAYGSSKVVRAVMTSEMAEIISRWGNPSDGDPDTFIFPYANGIEGDFAVANMVRKVICMCNLALKKIAQTLGIPKFTTYAARHSFATVLLKSGVNIKFISECLGHSSLAVTETYLAGFDHDDRMRNAAFLTDL